MGEYTYENDQQMGNAGARDGEKDHQTRWKKRLPWLIETPEKLAIALYTYKPIAS
jgi:hypothetical protein